MLRLSFATGLLLAAASMMAQTDVSGLATEQKNENKTTERSTSGRNYVDELVVTGERIDASQLDMNEIDRIYGHKVRAAREFIKGNYEEAFPTLLHLAKHGFVDAQARVGFIYLHGLGGQPKSNLKALGWLGVATSGDTRPQYRTYLNQLLREVPETYQALVDQTIADYTSRYNHEDKGLLCLRGGYMNSFTCRYEVEMETKYDYMAMLCLSGDPACPLVGKGSSGEPNI